MRLRLLRRRLTISAPRMAVRSALPWPFRWMLLAVMLGFSAAVALWAFELGKDIAGLERNVREELQSLRDENRRLSDELAAQRSVSNTSESLLTAERAAQQELAQRMRQLEAENRDLRADLGFFEQLMPSSGQGELHIRGLQTERVSESQLRWQALLMQPQKQAPEFKGQLEIRYSGTLAGKPWALDVPPQPVALRQYLRLEGQVDLPAQAVLKTVTARLLQGGVAKATQTLKL